MAADDLMKLFEVERPDAQEVMDIPRKQLWLDVQASWVEMCMEEVLDIQMKQMNAVDCGQQVWTVDSRQSQPASCVRCAASMRMMTMKRLDEMCYETMKTKIAACQDENDEQDMQ